jgi:hypothetical protein
MGEPPDHLSQNEAAPASKPGRGRHPSCCPPRTVYVYLRHDVSHVVSRRTCCSSADDAAGQFQENQVSSPAGVKLVCRLPAHVRAPLHLGFPSPRIRLAPAGGAGRTPQGALGIGSDGAPLHPGPHGRGGASHWHSRPRPARVAALRAGVASPSSRRRRCMRHRDQPWPRARMWARKRPVIKPGG